MSQIYSETSAFDGARLKFFILVPWVLGLTACTPGDVHTSKALSETSHSEHTILASDISADGSLTVVADPTGICLWNNTTSELVNGCITGEASEHVELVGVSGNNQFYFTSNRVSVNLYRASDGQQVGQWQADGNIINDIAISASGDTLVFGYRSGKAAVVNARDGAMATFDKHRLDINSVSISDDGQQAFSGASDKYAKLWSTKTGEDIYSLKHGSRVNHVDLSGDASVGFSIDAIKDRLFWDLKTGKDISELDSIKQFMEFNDSAFTADNQYLLSGSPKQKIKLWRVSDGELVGEWLAKQQRDRSSVLSVSISADNKVLTETSDGLLETWAMPPEL